MKIVTLRLLAALVLVGGLAGTATAQTQGDLRRENESLRNRVNELQRELDAARQEIARLTAENERLQKELAAGGTGRAGLPPLPPENVSVDESDVKASPRAVFNHIVLSYQKEMAGHEIGTEPTDSARRTYLRSLDQWSKRVRREVHGAVEWKVSIVEPLSPLGKGFQMKAEAIDPETGTVLGDPFIVMVPRQLALRLDRSPPATGDAFILKGTLTPRIMINPAREKAGPFDNPRLIGPFAEFAMTIVATAVIDPDRMPQRKGAAPAKGGGAGAGPGGAGNTGGGTGG